LGQRGQVETGAFVGQRLAAAVGIERLAVEVLDPGALDIGCARGLGLRAAVFVPALLPAGQRRFGVAQGVLAGLVLGLQLFQAWFVVLDRGGQHVQTRLVGADVLGDLGQCRLGFVAGLLQAGRHLAPVLDLLFYPGQRAAGLVAFALGLVQRFGGLFPAHATGLDLSLGLALLGNQLLKPGFLLCQLLAL